MERTWWRGHHALVRSSQRLRIALNPVYFRTSLEFQLARARRYVR
jgi:hypothetical protein